MYIQKQIYVSTYVENMFFHHDERIGLIDSDVEFPANLHFVVDSKKLTFETSKTVACHDFQC